MNEQTEQKTGCVSEVSTDGPHDGTIQRQEGWGNQGLSAGLETKVSLLKIFRLKGLKEFKWGFQLVNV